MSQSGKFVAQCVGLLASPSSSSFLAAGKVWNGSSPMPSIIHGRDGSSYPEQSEGHPMYYGDALRAADWFAHLGFGLPYGTNLAGGCSVVGPWLSVSSALMHVTGTCGLDKQQC
eukprot:scaffold46122_cov19-Tisochrysis_lutea.AAC.2